MNICFVCIHSSRSAIGDSFKNLCNHLKSKKSVYVIKSDCYRDDEFEFEIGHVLNIKFNKRHLFSNINPFEWKKLKTFILEKRIDHLFFYSDSPLNAFAEILTRKIDYSLWCHDPMPHSGVGLFVKAIRRTSDGILYKGKRLKKIFVASYALRETMIKCKRRLSENIDVVYLPYMEEITQYFTRKSFDERTFDFIFWGRIEDYKGLDILNEALRRLAEKRCDFRFLIVGKGDIEKYLDHEFLGNHQHIKIINQYVDNEQLAHLIEDSRTAVFPYKNSTGTQTVQTAIQAGCKVIATDTGSFKEYLQTCQNISDYQIVARNSADQLAEALEAMLKNNHVFQLDKKEAESFEKTFGNQAFANNIFRAITASKQIVDELADDPRHELTKNGQSDRKPSEGEATLEKY